MFTGIIEETGIVERVVRGARSLEIAIRAEKIFDDLKVGDSVAVNGICLTATRVTPPVFTADVMAETVRRTSLDRVRIGSRVNLERAMPANGRFGGHIVSGHIDGTGTVHQISREDNAIWIRIGAPEDILRYIVEKGSVALDGVSLTVAKTDSGGFSVSIIPHTASETTLSELRNGDNINIECDIIGKYVDKLTKRERGGITEDMLRRYGF